MSFALPAAALLAAQVAAAPPPSADADTRAWWATTNILSNDGMEGRDTGSKAYDRAAGIVAARFKAAGLKPLGNEGSWFQPVPMNEISVEAATASAGNHSFGFLRDFTFVPAGGMPTKVDSPLVYRGYCGAEMLGDVRGKMVICHGTRRANLPSAADRQTALEAAGAVGMINIIDPGFTVEPALWPPPYARNVSLADVPADTSILLRLTFTTISLAKLIAGSGQDAAALISAGSAGTGLPSFDVPQSFRASFTLKQRRIVSANVIGMLPGTDPTKAKEAIVLSAHLDAIGHGTPVEGDGLYNGTLDDAAYVALLIRLAERRQAKGYRRPIIFAAFTGEEKGLLGARWFVAHPPLPKSQLAADINLDQLRPIFPLDLLTVHALDDTSLGDDARAVASTMGIAVQRDPEPERNLLRRADHWPFLQAGIPATAFVFGYRPNSESERIYRRWYRVGYHKPQDDLQQPIDWKAATDFNTFFYSLVQRVADKEAAPTWKADSALRPQP